MEKSSSWNEYEHSGDDSYSKPIEVRRYALKYHPPTLIVEFIERKANKKRVRSIKFKPSSIHNLTAEELTNKLVEKNSDILSMELVSYQQLLDLVKLLLFSDISETSSLVDEIKLMKLKSGKDGMINGMIDLNKVSNSENTKAKEIMNRSFESRRLKSTDEGFIYDKRVDFEPPKEVCEWDEED